MEVPAVVRNKALAVGASPWLEELPAIVDSLEQEWSVAVGRPYDDATEAFVAEATLADGTPVVLKLLIPRAGDAAGNEITALRPRERRGLRAVAARRPGARSAAPRASRPFAARPRLYCVQRHEILCSTAERLASGA